MPWHEVSTMSLRSEFVMLASAREANIAELCRRFGVSRKSGYKWLRRYAKAGAAGLADHSRRPRHSPTRTAAQIEAAAIDLRVRRHWGARKIRRRLLDLGHAGVPAASTISTILKRHGLIDAEEAHKHRAFQRFEQPASNALWQMDFKGHFALAESRCHPLTVLDDHSRFAVALRACANERGSTVQQELTQSFRRYGLPAAMLMDNGPPWGDDAEHVLTPLTVWMIRLGIRVSHCRPYHPQTQGKDERFHRTLQTELLKYHQFSDLHDCQRHFDRWRDIYNLERPHEALGLQVPAQRYRPSTRCFPEALSAIEYGAGDLRRKVQAKGELFLHGRVFRISQALRGYPVALRPSSTDGQLDVYFCQQRVAQIDLRHPYR